MQRLGIAGRKTSFLLRTIGQERVVSSCALDGLVVAGLGSDNFYSLSEVLSHRKNLKGGHTSRKCKFSVL